jgi:AcrR family transcriptional regulator
MPAVPASAGPRRRLSAESRRRQLIDVALEAFAQTGFEATTMEDIATAAGVTKPLLYQHFASKRALYLELIDDIASRLLDSLQGVTAEPSWRGRVEAGMEAYFSFVLRNESAVRMLFDAPRDEELARGLRRIEDAIADFVAPLIEADIEEEHRRTIAAAVVGLTEGVTREWLHSRSRSVGSAHTGGLRSVGSAHPGDPGDSGSLGDPGGLGGLPADDAHDDELVRRLAGRVAGFAWGGLRSLRRDG